MIDRDTLLHHRLAGWGQTAVTRVPDPDAATMLIERAGIVTLYPVSPEFPDLFHAYAGPDVEPEATWDSPAGRIFSWRWALGRQQAAFYCTVVRAKPTWVAWHLLPALLRLRGELREPDELHAAGLLSTGALRIVDALAANGGVLTTGELRALAGFAKGKDQRAAYLRAIADLDKLLFLGRGFGPPDDEDDHDMRQTLVSVVHPDVLAVATGLTLSDAITLLLQVYMPGAAFIRPVIFARHLGLDRSLVEQALDALSDDATKHMVADEKHPVWVWNRT